MLVSFRFTHTGHTRYVHVPALEPFFCAKWLNGYLAIGTGGTSRAISNGHMENGRPVGADLPVPPGLSTARHSGDSGAVRPSGQQGSFQRLPRPCFFSTQPPRLSLVDNFIHYPLSSSNQISILIFSHSIPNSNLVNPLQIFFLFNIPQIFVSIASYYFSTCRVARVDHPPPLCIIHSMYK